MKIVIYGLGKSGTSALFYKIRNSLPPGTIELFEPSAYGLRQRLGQRLRALASGRLAPDVVAKVLPCDPRPVRVRDFDDFDHQVLIVRDPRDRLVSGLLYRSYHADFEPSGDEARAFLGLLRRKESGPGAVPLLRLVEAVEARQPGAASPWAPRYREQSVSRPLAFHDERPHLRVFRYEDMVDGRFAPLEAMLGIELSGPAAVPPSLKRVIRTKSYGSWRDWFTPADVEAVRPLLQPYLDRYYPEADWDLSPSPRLDPAVGSEYARRLINERRASRGLAPL